MNKGTRQPGSKQSIVEQFVLKYPEMPTRTLARMFMQAYPLHYSSLERARDAVRNIRGAHGTKHEGANEKLIRTKEQSESDRNNPYGLPESISDNWALIPFPAEGKGVIMSDMHFPYQDNAAITLALDWIKKNEYTDFILLNGDINDFHELSRFEKDPNRRDYLGELDYTKKFLDILQKIFKKVYLKEGNHEHRLPKFLGRNAETLLKIKEFIYEGYLDLSKRAIIHYKYDDIVTVGKLHILHGDEIANSASAVNPARGLFLKAKECAIESHFHRTSFHPEVTLSGKNIGCWSVGCMCTLHPKWLRFNGWNHGFAAIKINGKDFEILNMRVFTEERIIR
jgi:hypothetical protein